MRIIKVNGEIVRRDEGCGIRPLHPCPVMVNAQHEGYGVSKDGNPFNPVITITDVADAKLAQLYKDINNICESCYFGNAMQIRRRQVK